MEHKVDIDHIENTDVTELNTCQNELLLIKEQYAYLRADFDNYRRRQHQDQEAINFRSQAQLFLELLPIIDNFERAFKELQTNDNQQHMKQQMVGIELVYKELLKILARHEVVEMKNMQTFDPEFHEALLTIPAEQKNNSSSGNIIEIFQKGYLLKGKVLRPAQVSIAE